MIQNRAGNRAGDQSQHSARNCHQGAGQPVARSRSRVVPWGWLSAWVLGVWLAIGAIAPAWAAPAVALSQQPPIEVVVELGTAAGELRFVPNHLEFEAGKRYKLHLSNNSPMKHYFTAKDFADGIWSQKVDAGNVEVKGAIHELELRPNTVADWVFVPVRSGRYALRCTVPGHTEAGMTGELVIR
ncbi:MAG TPA: plastocyanin/azurin family copper-binding protein [Coleofasciculaceae cyanobacterium]